MKTKSLKEYIYIGSTFSYLNGVQAGFSILKEGGVLTAIKEFFKVLKEHEFNLTIGISEDLVLIFDDLRKSSEDQVLTEKQALQIRKTMKSILKTFFIEAGGKVTYIVTEKKYDTKKLLRNIKSLFADKVFDEMPDIAQYDFEEAGKCIAFERPTAAAFHLLRGTESVLRMLYMECVKRDRVRNLTWGAMLDHLEKRKINKLSKPLLDHLRNIKDNFRNPTQHPELIYDIEEAQDLLNLSIEVVNRIVAYLKKKKNKR